LAILPLPGPGLTAHNAAYVAPRAAIGKTVGANLRSDIAEAERTALETGNWRHNLKRSGKYGLSLQRWECRDAEEILAIYREMEEHKGLVQQVPPEEMQAILDLMGEQLVLWRCDDSNGTAVAIRACATFATQAWDLFAAATPAARKTYASYASFWALMRGCGEMGIDRNDMGGVDPEGNRGVFDFKKGCGATLLEYLGEWEWATPFPLSIAANYMIRRRNGQL